MHWNYPQTEPWQMAISCQSAGGSDGDVPELKDRGFRAVERDGRWFYVIERTEDAAPFHG